ncbi:hypothetical protein CVU82_02225 [Candidatus Falkowbacteria bacterium HGW-Falkowbacteria-1]|uniref:Uncharacterized protein n=1 Tax=Candidatus Falkowbacteria bacterium HGW-Falkowbacteria-1 TaxID=2013768 RepID=A0A2N2E9J9_9BACT|nr:MAG: hypothetical protein CVU82_02225 [Candidatus Falkowbacteria bacterium HGW-Falkowbacteria-1]
MKKIICLSIFGLLTSMLSAQDMSGALDLKNSSYTTFGDNWGFVYGEDSVNVFKTGKGYFNLTEFNVFLPERSPDYRLGISALFLMGKDGLSQVLPREDQGYNYHYRVGTYSKIGLGMIARFEDLIPGEVSIGAGVLYEKSKFDINKWSGDQIISYSDDISRFGFSAKLGVVVSGREDQAWLKKTEVSAFGEYFLKPDVDGLCFDYGAELNINLVSLFEISKFYVAPVLGAAIRENPMFSLGISPIISGGIAISSKNIRADLFKLTYQRRIYWQSSVPYSGIDGIFFSVNLGAFLDW